MPVIPFKERRPTIGADAFIAPDAWITGATKLGAKVSVFFGAVLRGDINSITVGDGCNIQEHAMLHTSHGLGDCTVGKDVTIGHHAIIHGCSIGDNCIIGMNATVLDGAKVGKNCIIGAQALVPMNMQIPEGSLAVGVPAKVVRTLTTAEIEEIAQSAASYRAVGAEYRRQL